MTDVAFDRLPAGPELPVNYEVEQALLSALLVDNKLMDEGMATVYGACFGEHFVDNVRFSFSATPVPMIEEALKRMRKVFVY